MDYLLTGIFGKKASRQVIEDKITGQEGVRALYKICIATDYASDFMIWLELDDALDSLLYGDYPFTHESATLDTFDEIAKREAANFIAAVCPQAANYLFVRGLCAPVIAGVSRTDDRGRESLWTIL